MALGYLKSLRFEPKMSDPTNLKGNDKQNQFFTIKFTNVFYHSENQPRIVRVHVHR